jgi:hypothetical protein
MTTYHGRWQCPYREMGMTFWLEKAEADMRDLAGT